MYGKIQQHLQAELQTIVDNGIFKSERIITSPQGAEITISTGEKVLNFCSNMQSRDAAGQVFVFNT